jgi:hypothetical protein
LAAPTAERLWGIAHSVRRHSAGSADRAVVLLSGPANAPGNYR